MMEQSEFRNCATHQPRGGMVEADLDGDTLQIDHEQGSGYCREKTTTYIPVEVLVKLLEHAGYTVEKPHVCVHIACCTGGR